MKFELPFLLMLFWILKNEVITSLGVESQCHRGDCGDELYESNGTCDSDSVISRGSISSATIILEIGNNLPFTSASSLLTVEMKEEELMSQLYSFFAGQIVIKAQLDNFHVHGHEGFSFYKLLEYGASDLVLSDIDDSYKSSNSADDRFQKSLVTVHGLFMATAKTLNFSRMVQLLDRIASVSDFYHPDFVMIESNIQSILATMTEFIWDNFSPQEIMAISNEVAPFSLLSIQQINSMMEKKLWRQREEFNTEMKQQMMKTTEHWDAIEERVEQTQKRLEDIEYKFDLFAGKSAELEKISAELQRKLQASEERTEQLEEKATERGNIFLILILKYTELEKMNKKLREKNAQLKKKVSQLELEGKNYKEKNSVRGWKSY